MENFEGELSWRSETVKEHLILISSYRKLPDEADRQEFIKFLTKVGYVKLSKNFFFFLNIFLTLKCFSGCVLS